MYNYTPTGFESSGSAGIVAAALLRGRGTALCAVECSGAPGQ